MYLHTNSISGTTVFAINYCNSIYFSRLQCSSPVISKATNIVTISIAFRFPALQNSFRTSPRPIFGSQPTSWKLLVCSPSMEEIEREARCCYNLPVRSSFIIGTISPPLIFFWGGSILLNRMILPLLFALTRAYIIPPLLCRISLF